MSYLHLFDTVIYKREMGLSVLGIYKQHPRPYEGISIGNGLIWKG
jgi:hypothetical protein